MRDMANGDGRIGGINLLLAVLAGVLCAGAMLLWGVPGLDPSLWDEVSIVAGIRPPREIFPGFWRLLTGGIFHAFGIRVATNILTVLGMAVGGISVMLFCLIVRHILALLFHNAQSYPVWCDRIAPFFSFVAALLFGMSDPFGRICRVFSPSELRLFVLLVIAFLELRWFAVGGRWRLFPMMALMGGMSAETPIAFVLPAIFVLSYYLVWRAVIDREIAMPGRLPEPDAMPKWRMFFLFLGGLALIVYINAAIFVSLGGLEANGWHLNDIYFRYAGGYWRFFASSSSLIGWVLGLGVCVVPMIVAMKVFPQVVHDDQPMQFSRGVMLFFVGTLAVMQTTAFPAANFWTFVKDMVMVPSGFLLTLFVLCAMLALALFGSAFAFECQRVYLTDDKRKPGPLLRGLVPFLTLGLIVLCILKMPKPIESEMQRIVDDAVEETVRECGNAEWLFTDGHLDTAIELEAAVVGSPLKALNMMSGASEWDTYVRKRNFKPESEDAKAAETGVPSLLRIWAGEKPNGMDGVAIQLGFEFWKREQKPLPRASGLLARETGMDEAEAKKGIERADAISRRILAIAPKMEKARPSPALASALSAVSWRLSRFAHLRNDKELANGLDLSNSALKRMLSMIEYERLRTFMQLTPREGLQLSLKRADFAEARRYSMAVLHYDEDDPEANFGMGMSAVMLNRFEDAERYLKRCLKRRPKEPVVLNNLSIVYRKLRKFDIAVEYAQEAIKLLPDSPEVKQTLEDALKKAP